MANSQFTIRDFQRAALVQVLTVKEVSLMWGKSRRAIETAFWKGKIIGRQYEDNGTILLSRESIVDLWGEPTNDIDLGV